MSHISRPDDDTEEEGDILESLANLPISSNVEFLRKASATTVINASVLTTGSLSITGAATSVTFDINLSNANTWIALQTFGNNISFGGAQLAVSSLTNGDILQYNGTNWVNVASSGLSYTDEQAQDAVGSILVDSTTIDFTYDDATPSITAIVKTDSINDTHIDWGTGANQVSLDDVPDGTSFERVAANQLSSGIYIDATTVTKGIASFDTNDFTVALGTVSIKDSGIDHGGLGGLSDDDHAQYALLAGRSGGQTLIGGTGVGDDITFQTTSNASKGSYIFSEMTIAGFLKNTTGGVVTGGNSIALSDISDYNENNYILADGTNPLTADWDAGSFEIRAQTFESDVVTGTAPLIVASTTKVTNLNADLLDGLSESAFILTDGTRALTGNWDAGSFEIRAETFESDVITGTAPLIVASTTLVTNLNADLLDGKNTGTSGNVIPLLDGVNTWSGNQIFDAGAHFNDNDNLTFGNTAVSPDGKIYSNGTYFFTEWDSAGAITPKLKYTEASFFAGAVRYPAIRYEGGSADGIGFLSHTLYVYDVTQTSDASIIVAGINFTLVGGDRFIVAVDSSTHETTLTANPMSMIYHAQGASLTHLFKINSNDEVTIGSDTMTFNAGASNPVLSWVTSGVLALTTGILRVDNKVSFTQTDNNEYIDSLTDGELDLYATTSINFGIGATEQVQVFDGEILPTTNNDVNLGSIAKRFKRLHEYDFHFKEDFIGQTQTLFAGSAAIGQTNLTKDGIGGLWGQTTSTTDDNANNKATRAFANITENTIFETSFRAQQTASTHVRMGLMVDTTVGMYFKYDTDAADTNWQCHTQDADSSEIDDSGVAVDTSFHIFRIEISSTTVTFYIDGTQVGQCTDVNDITTSDLPIRFYVQTRAASSAGLESNYVEVWQDR